MQSALFCIFGLCATAVCADAKAKRSFEVHSCETTANCPRFSCTDSLAAPLCYDGHCGCAKSPLGNFQSIEEAPQCKMAEDCEKYKSDCDEHNLLAVCGGLAEDNNRCVCLQPNGNRYKRGATTTHRPVDQGGCITVKDCTKEQIEDCKMVGAEVLCEGEPDKRCVCSDPILWPTAPSQMCKAKSDCSEYCSPREAHCLDGFCLCEGLPKHAAASRQRPKRNAMKCEIGRDCVAIYDSCYAQGLEVECAAGFCQCAPIL